MDSGDAQPRLAAWLALATAVLAVSWAAILVRLCEAPSLTIAFHRLAISTLVLVPVAAPGLRGVGRAGGGAALAAGVLLGLHFALWISSLEYTTIAASVVLVASQPAFTAVLGPLMLGERPGRRGWAAVALALVGTAILAGGDLGGGGLAWFGDLLALGGALTASLYLMIGRRVRQRVRFLPYLFLVYLVAAAALAVAALVGGVPLTGFPRGTWIWLVLMALGPNLLGHGLLNWSVRRLPALTVQIAILGEPVLATLYAMALFDEWPPPTFYAGASLIVAGIAVATLPARRSELLR